MSKKEKPILDFYQQFLADIGVSVGEDAQLFIDAPDDEKIPFTIIAKRKGQKKKLAVYIPTRKHMLEPEEGKRLYWHPACESSQRGQSVIHNKTMSIAGLRIYRALVLAVDTLLSVAGTPELHKKLNHTAMEYISQLPTVSEATVKSWRKLLKNTDSTNGNRAVIKIRSDRDIEIGGLQFNRVCKVYSPLIASHDLFGVNMSKSAEVCIRKAFDIVLGEDDFKEIVIGSNNPTAPYFQSFAKTYHHVMSNIRDINVAFSDYTIDKVPYSGKWERSLVKLHDWYKDDFFVQLDLNVGASYADPNVVDAPEPPQHAAVGSLPQPPMQPSVPVEETPAPTTSNETNINPVTGKPVESVGSYKVAPQTQPQYPPQPPQYQPPPPQYGGQPQYQQPPPQYGGQPQYTQQPPPQYGGQPQYQQPPPQPQMRQVWDPRRGQYVYSAAPEPQAPAHMPQYNQMPPRRY